MSLKISWDWKVVTSVLAAVAGIAVPIIWASFNDHSSLSVIKVSETALQPSTTPKDDSLKVTLDGSELSAPYLTVLKIVNDGRKPITSSKFEGSMEIFAVTGSIKKARLADKSPPDLDPLISHDGRAISIQPLLLNPTDSFTITVITADNKPSFAVKARIADIASVPVIAPPLKQIDTSIGKLIYLVSGASLIIITGAIIQLTLNSRKYRYNLPVYALIFVGIPILLAGSLTISIAISMICPQLVGTGRMIANFAIPLLLLYLGEHIVRKTAQPPVEVEGLSKMR